MLSPPDIDRIVYEVVRRLRLTMASGKLSETETGPTTEPNIEQLANRVVTLESLAQLPESTRRLAVCRGAVVTPSVRDELRQRNIELLRVDSATSSSPSGNDSSTSRPTIPKPSPQPKQLLIVDYQTPISLRDVMHGAQAAGIRIRTVADAMNPQELVANLAKTIDCRHVAIVFTSVPHVVSCAANRIDTIRAAVVQSTHCVTSAIRTLDTNVLVVDPTRWSTSDLVGVAKEITGAG